MDRPGTEKDLAATLERIKNQRPVYAELVDRFKDLFQVQADLAQRLEPRAAQDIKMNPERLRQGVSILADVGLPGLDAELAEAAGEIFPVLEASFPFKEEVLKVSRAVEDKQIDLSELARGVLGSDKNTLAAMAERAGVPEAILGFCGRCVLSPVLAALSRALGPRLAETAWTQGYCPVCGSSPAMASLSKHNNPRNEDLVGGGGKKKLICSLCSHQWAFRRDMCPGCGNEDHDQREIIFEEKVMSERIEACKKCGSYLLCVDLREYQGEPVVEALPLGLVHLDIVAQNKNYRPLAARAWNVAE
ncbi:MAG: formate dehydrogenase accessory protein FdhE [Desulfovibrionaceae bacterium]|nr:formate dehydrogenase accessory protein FdhE [Desulfovibrionaceae bacterium]